MCDLVQWVRGLIPVTPIFLGVLWMGDFASENVCFLWFMGYCEGMV